MQLDVAFVAGTLFALGLLLSGMTQPAKVIGFLDVTGAWDPTLAFVMGGALLIFVPSYLVARRRERPIVSAAFDLPTKTRVTPRLVFGAAVFGIGWGVSGMCPGAAIAALPGGTYHAAAVVVGMATGVVGTRWALKAVDERGTPLPQADF